MLSYHALKQDARVLRAFTSLDLDEFAILLMAFQNAWRDHITQHYVQRKSRKRRYGGGRKPHLLAIEVALCHTVDFAIDGTERPVQRPTDPLEQKDQYSGKKKAYG